MPTQKKFSTALFGLSALILGLALALQASAQTTPPAKERQRLPARTADDSTDVFVANAPDRHVVVKGDTLWGIAGKYLKSPWRWPQIWGMNRDQIRNPHWIYPGQVIILDKATGRMRLSDDTVNLRPSVRSEVDAEAIPSIPAEIIEPFVSRPIVVETGTMMESPRVIANREGIIAGAGATLYVSGITDPNILDYYVYRPGTPLVNPDDGNVIAYEAAYLGAVRVVRKGEPATVYVTTSAREISAGDRLVPLIKAANISYAPHAPEGPMDGRVVSIYGGVGAAGRNHVVALNRGKADGMEIGHVLALRSDGETIMDTTGPDPREVKLPNERNGLMFVFRLFDKISYALILDVNRPVRIGDFFSRP